ncbi:MAG: right-handed parallel beta-helix repeat-containing protein [Chloroflexi bacterium]|nr:right-handed parallel beta-helix repeat-containing protein [Chloroflexota bacterium]MCI0649380.1 right-handed parallel beta-helix repeat-containing protein [Chloroflexota bacterium]MCI0727017.1 right-handed parallel beta-helix repeat-containing protein [Chloroflexota bacterium]
MVGKFNRRIGWLAFVFVVGLLACNLSPALPAATERATAAPNAPAASEQPTAGPLEEPAPAQAGPATQAPPAGSGRTLYVAPDGSDDNDGSQGGPLQTIQKAVDAALPGDTVVIQGGTYVGARIENSGTAGAWITLTAAPGQTVLINAPGPNNQHDSNLEVETWEGDGIVAYWIIEGLEVAGAPNWGIDLRGNDSDHSHHFIVRGNIVHDNGLDTAETGIFTAFVDDVTVENNESYGNGEHGIYLSNSGDRFTVRRNRLHDNANCGLHMNGDLSQGGDGIISDGLVEANVIYENGVGGCAGVNMDGVTDTIVRNNLIYQNHASGIAIFQEDGGVCSRDNRVLNNTIVLAGDARWAVTVSHDTCINNKLFNNILYTGHSFRGTIEFPATAVPGFESDYNIVMDRFSVDGGNNVITLAQWQALGYDANSFIAEPADLFLNLANDDYHLYDASPARDAGVALPDVPEDLDGRPRPVGPAFDIGAYEFAPFAGFLPLILAELPSGLNRSVEVVDQEVIGYWLLTPPITNNQ